MGDDASQKTTPLKKKVVRGKVIVEWEMCKGCGFCVEFCPSDALVLSPKFNAKGYHPPVLKNPERCSGCGLCGTFCPDFAIFGHRVTAIDESEQPQDKEKTA